MAYPPGFTPIDDDDVPPGFTAIRSGKTPAAPSTATPISADEPTTYWGGFAKGAKEGVVGGATGFAAGMIHSPKDFVNGIISMLTTSPVETVAQAIESIKRIPEAIQQAGADPEAWGEGVGSLTGQTMIGAALPAAGRGVVRGAKAAAPYLKAAGPILVKPAATAVGGLLGGTPGAVAGSAVGDELAKAMRAKMKVRATPATPTATVGQPEVSLGSPVTESASAVVAAGPSSLRTVDEIRAWAALKDQGMSAADAVKQIVAQRGTAVAAEATPMATLAQPTTAAAAATPIQALRDAAARLGQILQPYELSNGKDLLLRGVPPEKAVEVLIRNRPKTVAKPIDPAEAFNAKFGTLTDVERDAALDKRWAKGELKTPSAATARARRAQP